MWGDSLQHTLLSQEDLAKMFSKYTSEKGAQKKEFTTHNILSQAAWNHIKEQPHGT